MKIHGLRLAVKAKLVPEVLDFQGTFFKITEMHSANGGYWFKGQINLGTEEVTIETNCSQKRPELKEVRYSYINRQDKRDQLLALVKENVNWLDLVYSLDATFQGLYAMVTSDKKHQITFVF